MSDTGPIKKPPVDCDHSDCVSMTLFKWTLGSLCAIYMGVLTLYTMPEIRSLQAERDERLRLAEQQKWEMNGFKEDLSEVKTLAVQSVAEVNKISGRIAQCAP